MAGLVTVGPNRASILATNRQNSLTSGDTGWSAFRLYPDPSVPATTSQFNEWIVQLPDFFQSRTILSRRSTAISLGTRHTLHSPAAENIVKSSLEYRQCSIYSGFVKHISPCVWTFRFNLGANHHLAPLSSPWVARFPVFHL